MFENKDITWIVVDEAGNNIVDWTKEQIDTHIVESKVSTFGNACTYYGITDKGREAIHNGTEKFKNKNTITHKTVLDDDLIPEGLRDKYDIDFDPDIDIYFSYTWIEGFTWSSNWQCFTMDGEACRKMYNKKKKRGRPPKGDEKK